MIINLTQHNPTLEQIEVGVTATIIGMSELLTFNTIPTQDDIDSRVCDILVSLTTVYGDAPKGTQVMIGGAPFLMAKLEDALIRHNYVPVYSFSQRVSVESTNADGVVVKVNQFKHVGFVI